MNHKSRVRVLKTTYFENADAKTTVCILECTLQLDKLKWADTIVDTDILFHVLNKFAAVDSRGRFKVKAVAKCSADDEFNSLQGKRIAESKAKKKAFAFAVKYHNFVSEKLREAAKEFSITADACQASYVREAEHLNRLNSGICD